MEIGFHEQSLSHILCSEIIHHFVENLKYQSRLHVMFGLLNTREGPVSSKKRGPCGLSDVYFTQRLTCLTIYEIKQFCLPDVPFS